MVKASYHDAKGTFPKFLLDFISVIDLLFGLVEVVCLVVVETVVVDLILIVVHIRILVLAVDLAFDELADALALGVEV